MTIGHGGRLAGRDELFARVLADRLKHPVPHRVAVHDQERPVDEPRQAVLEIKGISRRRSSPTMRTAIGTVQPPLNTDRRRQEATVVIG